LDRATSMAGIDSPAGPDYARNEPSRRPLDPGKQPRSHRLRWQVGLDDAGALYRLHPPLSTVATGYGRAQPTTFRRGVRLLGRGCLSVALVRIRPVFLRPWAIYLTPWTRTAPSSRPGSTAGPGVRPGPARRTSGRSSWLRPPRPPATAPATAACRTGGRSRSRGTRPSSSAGPSA